MFPKQKKLLTKKKFYPSVFRLFPVQKKKLKEEVGFICKTTFFPRNRIVFQPQVKNTIASNTSFRTKCGYVSLAYSMCKYTEKLLFLYAYAISVMYSYRKNSRHIGLFQSEKIPKSRVFDERKTPLRCLLDAIITLTFFDAVVIAIATCSYRDSNMMLST